MSLEQLTIITGLSGAGKTHAARCFEDMGSLVVDNLPSELIAVFADLIGRTRGEITRAALVVDVREGRLLADLPDVVRELRKSGQPVRILFLEASDAALLRRFSETRRPHPLDAGAGLEDAIRHERDVLQPVRALADQILDTSALTVHDMRQVLNERFHDVEPSDRMRVSVVSFGYKHGPPAQADIVLDVRFLPNPFFHEQLRELSGEDEPVRAFLRSQAEYREFLGHLESLLGFLLPQYVAEGKSYLNLAFGCTGGRHRSVAVAIAVARHLTAQGYSVRVAHRDIRQALR